MINPDRTKPKTVLLVDDDPESRDVYRILLTRSGYHVLEAGDGGEAVLLAHSEAPDLIVMNVNMPQVSGVDAIHLLKQDATTSGIPVLVLSGHEGPAISDMAWEAGCDDYLVKPVSPKVLEQEIRSRIGPPVAAGG
jgi:CheY-like chemotaxis protein